MSGLYENLPFKRGATWGAADNTLATWMEGREYIIEDDTYGTGMYVKLRVCRNNSGAAIIGKRALKFNLTAGKGFYDVAGYCTVAGEYTAVADDLLPAAGAPSGDLFYAVVEGPCLARTSMVGGISNSIAVGDPLQAVAGATTGATSAGRLGEADLTGATSVLGLNVLGVVGYAMSAKTTANTNVDLLVNMGDRF